MVHAEIKNTVRNKRATRMVRSKKNDFVSFAIPNPNCHTLGLVGITINSLNEGLNMIKIYILNIVLLVDTNTIFGKSKRSIT